MAPSIARHGSLVSITCYFLLNLFVTYTNKEILGRSSQDTIQRPYLLTASHGVTSFIGCIILKQLTHRISRNPHVLYAETKIQAHFTMFHQYICLVMFSLFYTINIALSNISLALVDLPLNQTVRATAPVLTVIVSVFFLRHPLHTYSTSTCLSLLPIVLGLVVAVSSPGTMINSRSGIDSAFWHKEELDRDHRTVGIVITLLGALTAVLKTILTHRLMTSLSLKLSALELLHILSPYAAIQAFAFAYFTGECGMRKSELIPNKLSSIRSQQVLTIWTTNAIAAFVLNIASFEANKRNGPVSMAVAANLKQVAILTIPLISANFDSAVGENTRMVTTGTALTVVGGIWYAWSTARDKSRQAKVANRLREDVARNRMV